MNRYEYYVECIYVDKKSGRYVSLAVSKVDKFTLSSKNIIVPWEEVISSSITFENATIVGNRYVRGKGVKLPRKVVRETRLLDFKNSKVYNGVTPKVGVTLGGIDYIAKSMKSPSDTSVFSEYVASRFISNLGFSAHNVRLFKDSTGVYLLAEDFTQYGNRLVCFKDTRQSSEDTDIVGKEYTYDDVLYLIGKHTKIKDSFKRDSIRYFWNMFLLDGILGNRDRHHGNWGYLSSSDGYKMAPLFDNGASLFPDISRVFHLYAKDKVSFLLDRCEKFPASLLCDKVEGVVKRTNFYYFINSKNLSKYPDLKESLSLFRGIGIDGVYSAISSAVDNNLIPSELKRFYIEIVCCRYLHIIHRVPLEEIGALLSNGFPFSRR